MTRRDPWLPARMRAHATLTRGEHRLHAAVVTAMTIWLDTARALVLGQPAPTTITADGGPTPDPDPDELWNSLDAWTDALEQHIEPAIADAFGESFAHEMRTADISPLHWQEQHMATVHDRLKIWPEGSFEELRYELLEAMANHEDVDQAQDRIGRILGIDAPARRIRAEISAVDRKLADPLTPPSQIAILKGKRRQLWNQHDERNLEWQWLARRIARTEIQGAIEGGALAAAQAAEEETGEPMYKRWLSTHDERTRLSHSVADGQMVRLTEPFIVGGSAVQHPADPFAPGHESINCRCSLAILSWGEMQAELQGMWGGRGVGPMNARLGPDDEADVAAAIDRLKREQRGEVIEDTAAPATTTTTDAEELNRKYEEDKHPRQKDGKWGRKNLPDTATPESAAPEDDRTPMPGADPTHPQPGEPVEDTDATPSAPPRSAGSAVGGPTPEDAAALASQLDQDFAEPIANLTPEQRSAIERWQGMDRFYSRVQNVIRKGADDEEAATVGEYLDQALRGSSLVRDVQLWRGIRDSNTLFGRANADLPQLIGTEVPTPGYLAASVSREQATSGFTDPHWGGGPVLLNLQVAAGTAAIWVSGAGDQTDELRNQGELLMGAASALLIVSVDYSGPVPVVNAEVI